MLFRKKPKQEKPDAFYVYTQTKNYKGFKRIKLSSYGYQPALDGIRRLADADLSGAEIKISVFGGDSPSRRGIGRQGYCRHDMETQF